MNKIERCKKCGAVKIYDCEQCYGVDDTEENSVENLSDKCLNQCANKSSKDKKND